MQSVSFEHEVTFVLRNGQSIWHCSVFEFHSHIDCSWQDDMPPIIVHTRLHVPALASHMHVESVWQRVFVL